MADALRWANLILAVVVIAVFPMTAFLQGRRGSAFLAIAGSELIWFAVVFGSMAHLGEPMNIRLLLVTASGLLYLAFFVAVALERARSTPRGPAPAPELRRRRRRLEDESS